MRREIKPISPTKALARCFCGACLSKVLRDDAMMYAIRDADENQRTLAAAAKGAPSSSKWDHDDIDDLDDEILLNNHAVVLVAPDSRTFDAGLLSSKKKPQQLSKYGAPLGSNKSIASSFRRSAVSPRHRQVSTAPDVLLRSDAGKRNWNYSTTALSLRSPQRNETGIAIVQRVKHTTQLRLSGKSPRTPSGNTPRNGSSGGDFAHAGRLSSSSSVEGTVGSTKSQRQRQFFRELYQK